MPFIIRGVSLLGVASAGTARDIRDEVWRRLASGWKPRNLDSICTREATLEQLPDVFDTMLAGGSMGRTLVDLRPQDRKCVVSGKRVPVRLDLGGRAIIHENNSTCTSIKQSVY